MTQANRVRTQEELLASEFVRLREHEDWCSDVESREHIIGISIDSTKFPRMASWSCNCGIDGGTPNSIGGAVMASVMHVPSDVRFTIVGVMPALLPVVGRGKVSSLKDSDYPVIVSGD